MNGTKIPQDTRRVLFYFQQATDLGHSESQMISGYLYKVGAAAELFVCASMTNPSDEIV